MIHGSIGVAPRFSSDPQQAIAEMAQRIVVAMHPEMIVLFGSYARGAADPDSDADLLVVMPFEGSSAAVAARIYGALHGRPIPVDIIVVRPEQLTRYRDQVGTIIQPALRDGRVLYRRAA